MLQEGVVDTVNSFQKANIKLWMLSGDRIENVASMAVNSGMIKNDQDFYFITGCTVMQDAFIKVENYEKVSRKSVLVMDGKSLGTIL